MRVCALDPGTHLGWAIGNVGERCKSGVYRMPGRDLRWGLRLAALNRYLLSMLDGAGIERCYYEEPFTQFWGGEGPPRSFDSELVRWGLPNIIEMACAQTGVETMPVAVGSWRSRLKVPTQAPKVIKGTEARRKWLKQATADKVSSRGYTTSSPDESDAVAIWLAMTDEIMRRQSEPGLPLGFVTVKL